MIKIIWGERGRTCMVSKSHIFTKDASFSCGMQDLLRLPGRTSSSHSNMFVCSRSIPSSGEVAWEFANRGGETEPGFQIMRPDPRARGGVTGAC